jgi:hypothetical protein
MFPPPMPWKQVAEVDPDREYLAFTSRFSMKSPFRVLAFLRRTGPIQEQVSSAAGIVGWSLGADLLRMEFHTLSVWEDEESLLRFAREGVHAGAMQEFLGDMRRPSLFLPYTVRGRELPLTWKDAVRRQKQSALAEGVRDEHSGAS